MKSLTSSLKSSSFKSPVILNCNNKNNNNTGLESCGATPYSDVSNGNPHSQAAKINTAKNSNSGHSRNLEICDGTTKNSLITALLEYLKNLTYAASPAP